MKSVSIIGLGSMGSVLGKELLRGGHRVTVWNRSPDKAEELAAAGAALARSASEAIGTSDVTITCIRSHKDTRKLLEEDPSVLAGKTIVELSTGDSAEATSLMQWLRKKRADCLIGMISVFPKDIGKPDSAILAVGSEAAWADCEILLKTLAGASIRVGEDPVALAALYASLVVPRQAFMFGMIYGASICEKAGVSMDTYVQVLPLTIKIVQDYYDLFAATVPEGNFEDPPASLGVYHAAFKEVLNTCGSLGAADELPKLLHGLLERGMEAGLGHKQVTSLIRLIGK